MQHRSHTSGFTLLEVLLVVAAIAILAGIVIFAINPGKQLAELRNAKREADISLIVNAVYQYAVDNRGAMPADIVSEADSNCPSHLADDEICTSDGGKQTCGVDLIELTDNQKYLVSTPVDPNGSTQGADGTGYVIHKNENGRLVACAPNAELGKTIQIVR